ncbi:unnamed protein product [Aspergillus oryzae]|nr:unnamed protein product [Aspergillus oryzae]GMF94077.1 unnamed protein product [Aspergillus oryzae]
MTLLGMVMILAEDGGAVIPAISRAENIALLSLLHSASRTSPLHVIPTAPSSNIPEHSDSARNYELSVDKERSLVGTLAFLAQTEEDPNHIPAICVEQDTDRLNVLIAINKAKWSDGDSILHVLEERLNMIFAIMQTVLERELGLRASRKQTKKSKKPIKEILQNVIRCAKQVAEKPGASESLQAATLLFRYKAREVASLIDSWQGHQTVARLGDLVKGINQLHQVNQLSDLVNEIPAPELQNEAKKSFLNTIGKVSRYAEAPRILRRIAKRFRVARYMTAVPVNLPKEAFCIPTKGTYAPDIGSSVARIDHQYSDRKRLNRVYHLLGYTEAQSASLFSEQVLRTLREAKIHAEIQLVIYCELQRPTLFPRVVCSSKDACFLCSTFISLHKQIHTPRCHGRLYPGWRLPSVPQVKELEERFNKTLENSIKESLSMLFSRQRKTTYPPPNESTLLTIPISETTKSDLTQLDLWQLSCERSIQLRSQMTDQPHKAPESGNPSYASIPCGAACEGSTTDLEFPPMVEGQDPDSKIISKQELSQGIVLHNSIDPGGSSACYIAGPIKLTIEYATGLEGIKYSVEWLTAEEMKDLQGRPRPPLSVDVGSLASEMSIQNHNSVCILMKGTALRLDWESKTSEKPARDLGYKEDPQIEGSPAPVNVTSPAVKKRDDAGSSPSQGRRQSPNRPNHKVGILSTSNLVRSTLNQMASICLPISRCPRPPHLCQTCWTGLFGEAGFRELLLPGGSRRYMYRTSWSGLATSETCNWCCQLLLINREITDRDDELMVIVEMREEESRDITPPGEQRLWVFLNNEDSAHHAAGYIPTSAGYYPGMEPVNTRGWCFQEHMLATRALVFASHTLQYHCRTNGVRNIGNSYNYSPDGTAGRVPGRIFSMAESMRSQGSSIQPPARTSLSAEEWKSTREAWFAALRNYTPRSVSHPADKLIAFAAIAETFHALCSETRYLAGLWEDTLLEDLLWKKPKPPLPRPEAYRAPSWSWASVDGKTTSALTTLYYSGCPA